jgi:hypothetical protein
VRKARNERNGRNGRNGNHLQLAKLLIDYSICSRCSFRVLDLMDGRDFTDLLIEHVDEMRSE